MEGGGLSVMMGSDRMMLMLLVDNWDAPKPAVLMMWVYQGRRRFTFTLNQSCSFPNHSIAVSVVIW